MGLTFGSAAKMSGVQCVYARLRVWWVVPLFAVSGCLLLLRQSLASSESASFLFHGPIDYVDVETGNTTTQYTFNTWRRQYRGLPLWLDRYPFLPAPRDVPDSERVCFVAVGKTAGNTLSCYFGFITPKCNHRMKLLPGKLPQYTSNMIHVNFDSCKRETIGIYLFTVRDPLDRLMSWFTYERPDNESNSINRASKKKQKLALERKKPLYLDCSFETMNDLGEKMSEGDLTECSRVAWRAVTGSQGYRTHNRMNYEYYWRKIPHIEDDEFMRIAVIRTEHLEQDWASVERVSLKSQLPPNTTFSFGKKNQSSKTQQDQYLSATARQNLCQGLCQEIQIYKRILRRAENLSPGDLAASLHELEQNCPVEAAAEHCPDLTDFLRY